MTVRVTVSALALALAAAGCGHAASPRASELTASQVGEELNGAVLRPPNVEPPITLTATTTRRRYDIATSNPGKVTLLYFGYTHCPDVCPTTMADIAQALRQSTPAVRSRVVVLFATIDPHRDSLTVLREWLARFSPRFIGLRGSLPQMIAAQRAAGLPPGRVEANGNTIEHAAQVIAYTPDHLEHVFYFEGPSTIEDLHHDLPILVSAPAYA